MNYIVEHALIMIPVLNILGLILKSFQKLPDKYIPLVLLVFGLLGTMSLLGFNVENAIQGILVTGTAVYGNQVVKQLKKTE